LAFHIVYILKQAKDQYFAFGQPTGAAHLGFFYTRKQIYLPSAAGIHEQPWRPV
jgi:hypothetical protein